MNKTNPKKEEYSAPRKEETSSKRMTVSFPPETTRMLEILSELQSITLNEAIRRAISTESLIQHEIRSGSKIIIKPQDGEKKELIFR